MNTLSIWKTVSKKQLIVMYKQLSSLQVGKELGCSDTTVRRILHELGAQLRPAGRRKTQFNEIYHGLDLQYLYLNKKLSAREISQIAKVSQKAVSCALKRRGIKIRSNNIKGPESCHWKGGIVYHSGYRMIYCPSHPRASTCGSYVYEHILVWEKFNHTHLPKGWHIHHLNGVKDDNRPENLLGMPHSLHSQYIPALQTKLLSLENKISFLKKKLEDKKSV